MLKLSPDHPFEFSEADVCSAIVAKLTASLSLSPIYLGTGRPEQPVMAERNRGLSANADSLIIDGGTRPKAPLADKCVLDIFI